MKSFKLKLHNSTNDDAFLFNSSDLPKVKEQDLLKVYQNDDTLNYLLFQVKVLKENVVGRDCVSVEHSLATKIGLQVFHDVIVVQVEAEDVTIDLLEVLFKDQYISRSDMWRMKKHLVNSCVYIDQMLEYTGIRAQVCELWVNSKKSRCGFINDSTNIVLRSYTAKVYVFIQMSSEMWEYDAFGYLQFERAIDGFLKALFTRWKEKKCCHQLTLVLFSRTFYSTCDVDDFPEQVRDSVRIDYLSRLYLDFYKCVVQSEKIEDCTPLLNKLKKLVHKYDELIYIPGCPKGTNSKSAEGNFLEAINMSLNVFERHNVDRHFDGTGQIVVCITPGVGVFDVDRELTILTKERMIDNGIGSDLICLGQQPLHAVPLFKFHQKLPNCNRVKKFSLSKKSFQAVQHDFNIPHWINHSFYTSNPFPDQGTTNIKFIPRIYAPIHNQSAKSNGVVCGSFSSKSVAEATEGLLTIQQMSFDEYDKQIFSLNKPTTCTNQIRSGTSSLKHSVSDSYKKKLIIPDAKQLSPENKRRRSRPMHIPLYKYKGFVAGQETMTSSLGTIAKTESHCKQDNDIAQRPVIGSATSSRKSILDETMSAPRTRRALFNPFNPLQMFAPLTANRRRWVHTYPRGPLGEALVLHHRNSTRPRIKRISHRESESTDDESSINSFAPNGSSSSMASSPAYASLSVQYSLQTSGSYDDTTKATSFGSNPSCKGNVTGLLGDYVDCSSGDGGSFYRGLHAGKPISSFGLSWMWGIAGDIQWTTDTYTGLDWKSLKCPACLPITTDYCPQQSLLQSQYTEYSYTLAPEFVTEQSDEDLKQRADSNVKETRGAREIFLELVNQRLCQGYQIIKQSKRLRSTDSGSSGATITSPVASEGSHRSLPQGTSPLCTLKSLPISGSEGDYLVNGFMLSHGRQYHILRISPDNEKIEVKIYKQRHPSLTAPIDYNYMLWPKTRKQFQTARTVFSHETSQDSYWNHLDDYVCYPDDSMFQNLIYWRTKFVALSAPARRLQLLKVANEKNEGAMRFDVFTSCGCKSAHKTTGQNGECDALTEGFVRFLEHINKFKRSCTSSHRKSWKSCSMLAKSYQSSSSSSGAIYSNQATPTPPRPTSSTPTSERSTPVRVVADNQTNGNPPLFSENLTLRFDIHHPVPMKHSETNEGAFGSGSGITVHTEMNKTIAAMKDSHDGICFIAERDGIPKYTFASLDAVQWVISWINGINTVKEACDHLERLRSYKFFTHVSGDPLIPFRYGFVLYSICEADKNFELEDQTSYQYQPSIEDEQVHNQWFEVAIKRLDLEEPCSQCRHSLFNQSLGKSGAFVPTQKKFDKRERILRTANKLVKLPLRNKIETKRSEWCQISYLPSVRCGVDNFLFSFELQWLIATATSLFETLQMWFRYAGRCDLYFFPVPCQPFAFPGAGATSPLMSPLFVQLNVKSLQKQSEIFREYMKKPEKYHLTIITMMEEILHRFGFIRDDYFLDNGTDPNYSDDTSENFVHFTGQVLAQIPIHFRIVQRKSICARRRQSYRQRSSALNHMITTEELDGTGFYWSDNHMQTKRWRLPVLDECPPAELQRDFVSFCSNNDDRLLKFFNNLVESI